jgi:1-acyl-sn-glycerol-3-phosphate acyltransferase
MSAKPTDVPANWHPPTSSQLAAANGVLATWKWLTDPIFLDTHNVPKDRPIMFIANHTLMGMVDTPLLMLGIYEQTGHFPRSMGDNFHFKVPGWRDLLIAFGAVHGTRDNCRQVMDQGHSLVVFPGGGREVFKRRGEAYQLIWGKRSGFARLAIEKGYAVVPVAAVGAEECYKIVLDQDDILKTSWGRSLTDKAPRGDVAFPTLARGIGLSIFPRPQRFYFRFGELIESAPYAGAEEGEEDEAIFALREEVRLALQALIGEVLEYRENDPRRSLTKRLFGVGRG